jgi:WD40 repeat protein/transcriptional regulator with XRE-family HTH domain
LAHTEESASEQHADRSLAASLLRLRLRLALSQQQFAELVGVHSDSIRAWESGTRSPSVKSLQSLIGSLVLGHGFSAGRELAEAAEMWAAAQRQMPRLRMPFDHVWFTHLLAQSASMRMEDAPLAGTQQHWGDAPQVDGFVGRGRELQAIRGRILRGGCQVVGVLGIGGVGKSTFVAKLAREVAPEFDHVYWTSLRNARSPAEWLDETIGFLVPEEPRPVDAQALQRRLVLDVLRRKRCLLVLDNLETVLEPGEPHGRFREGFEAYGSLLRSLAEGRHGSCLVLTSREAPSQLSLLRNECSTVECLELQGLEIDASRLLLEDKKLSGDAQDWASLVRLFGGNPLALKVVGETVRQVFEANLSSFVQNALASGELRFAGIRQVLDDQFGRMSALERDVALWLAVEREPVTFAELAADLHPAVRATVVLEIVEALRRRSLLDRAPDQPALALQPVVLDYVTELVVHAAGEEVLTRRPALLLSHALVKATATDHVRSSQERFIAAPILEHVAAICRDESAVEARLNDVLELFRARPRAEHGYGPGNLVNLMRVRRGNLHAANLSGLSVRQGYLSAVEAHDANLANTDLAESVIAEAFDYPACIALSIDGAYLAVGTATGEVRLWRLDGRTLTLRVAAHAGAVTGIALSEDGRFLASAGMDGMIKAWETSTARLLGVVGDHAGMVRGLAMSADGKLLASSGLDGTVKLWDARVNQLRATLDGHAGGAWCVALSAGGELVASGAGDGTIKLWNATSGQQLSTVRAHSGGVRAVVLLRDHELVASGGADGSVKLWLTSGKLQAVLEGHDGAVTSLAISLDRAIVASGGMDHTVKLWAIPTGEPLATLDRHTAAVTGVALASNGRLVASGSQDGAIRVSETSAGRAVVTLHGRTGAVLSLALSGSGDLAATGRADGTLQLWDTRDDRLATTVRAHRGFVYCLALTGTGSIAASGGADGTAKLWRVADGRCVASCHRNTAALRGVALSENGQVLATCGDDGAVAVWNAASGQLIVAVDAHSGPATCVALSDTGEVLASGGLDGMVRLWRGTDARSRTVLQAHTGGVWAVALSGDGKRLLTGGQDGTVKLWDANNGRLRSTLPGHFGAVLRVALSGDGRRVASGGLDGTLNVSDSDAHAAWVRPQGHPGGVMGAALSADGRLLASCGNDGAIAISDAISGAELRNLRGPRLYERMRITGLTGVTAAQRDAMIALGAIEPPEVTLPTRSAEMIN